jgi:hypothetical protein
MQTINDYINAGLTHSLHNSETASYRGCRRRWNWVAREMYYPRVTARPLEFGVAFHEAMETYYGFYLGHFANPDPNAALQLAILAFKRKTQEQLDNYKRLNGGIDTEMLDDYKDRVELGVGMLNYYFGKIAPRVDEGLKPLKVEIKFEVPIDGPNGETLWCKCDHCWKRWTSYLADQYQPIFHNAEHREKVWKGLPVSFGGRIDAIMEDLHGRIWIFDWKTAQRLSGDEEQMAPDDFLWNENQITGYCWALWRIGLNVAGFIYAEIKKAVPQEPERLSRPYKGRWFSTNKQQTTTYDMALATFKEYDYEGYSQGLYEEYLEYLMNEGSPFHKRHEVTRNQDELEEFGRNLFLQAAEMTDPNVHVYPNPGKFHCKTCAFWEPCLGKNRGEDYQFTLETMFEKRDRHYWEEAPPSTDKKMEVLPS